VGFLADTNFSEVSALIKISFSRFVDRAHTTYD